MSDNEVAVKAHIGAADVKPRRAVAGTNTRRGDSPTK
jgi:hypothetical protein